MRTPTLHALLSERGATRALRFGLPFCLALLTLLLAHAALTASAQSRLHDCRGTCARLANAFVRADVGPNGAWVLGTTGGDPATDQDDDRRLLYGFEPAGASKVGYGYSTVRAQGARGTVDWVAYDPSPQTVEEGAISHVWRWRQPYAVAVTQTLRLRTNRFSQRPDMAEARYLLRNEGSEAISIGLRALFDIKLDSNDGAPYFIPGVGTLAHEVDFRGDAVPDYWLAFASPRFDADGLRAMGLLRDPAFRAPDRLVIARWFLLQNSRWDYSIEPTQVVTRDSAVAMYFNPRLLAPGETAEHATAYGLHTARGGEAFLTVPGEVACGDAFSVAAFVSNFGLTPLAGGRVSLQLGAGLALEPGEALDKQLPEVPPGGAASVTWRLRAAPGLAGVSDLAVKVTFPGRPELDAAATLRRSCAPTPTATATPTPRASSTPTAGRATASPSPSPAAEFGRACAALLGKVPPAAVSDALANPAAVFGWRQPANPALPPGPNNPLRVWLSVRDLGKAYHPIFNPLIYKVGCP